MEVIASDRTCRPSEAVLLGVAVLSPWAFGGVEAWALLLIDGAVLLAACLRLRESPRRGRDLLGTPHAAIAALACLAMIQAAPLPWAWPGALGIGAGRVLGDPGPPVPAPASTLSVLPGASTVAAARIASGWLVFLAASGLGGGAAPLHRLALLMTANGAAMALFAMIQAMTWDGRIFGLRGSPIADGWRTGGPFVGHNALAAYLNLALGLGVGLLLAGAKRPAVAGPRRLLGSFNPWPAYASAVILFGLVGSHSRSGLIAAVVTAVAVAVLLRREARRTVIAIGGMAAVVATLLLAAGDRSPFQRLATVMDRESYGDRLEIWGAAARAWSHAPWLGSGFGAFATAVAPESRHDRGVAYARAENEYLDVLVEGGIVGLVLVLAAAGSILAGSLRAMRDARTPHDRALIAGGLFGLIALAVQSAADFSPHIAGVAMPALVVCGYLVGAASATRPSSRRVNSIPLRAVAVGVAVLVSAQAYRLARSESELSGSGLPPPGSRAPSGIAPGVPEERLVRMKDALERALAVRPSWAEGWLRLASVRMGLYQTAVLDELGDEFPDPADRAMLADPLWLHGAVHSSPDGPARAAREALEHEAVREHLAEAARCLLRARSHGPSIASVHANLAVLDYLVEGETAEDHVRRALATAGADFQVRMKASRAASQSGRPDLAAEGWRTCIQVRETAWPEVLVEAGQTLGPAAILEKVLPRGAAWPVLAADVLFIAAEDAAERAPFYEAALERLADDRDLGEAERSRIEARAGAGLGRDRRAREAWARALALEPGNSGWRAEFVDWLASRGEAAEAHENAVAGLIFHPEDARLRAALLATAESMARGAPTEDASR